MESLQTHFFLACSAWCFQFWPLYIHFSNNSDHTLDSVLFVVIILESRPNIQENGPLILLSFFPPPMTLSSTFCSSPPTPSLFFHQSVLVESPLWNLFFPCFIMWAPSLLTGSFWGQCSHSSEGPFTIDIVGFQTHLWPQFFQLSSQYQMPLVSFRKAEWILCDEQHRVVVKGLDKLWCRLPFFPSFLLVLATGRSVCASQNIRSSWWMVTPLLFYFFLLETVGAYGGVLSTENTWFLYPWERFVFPVTFFPVASEEGMEKEAFFFFYLWCLFNLLTLHLLYWWAEFSCPWLFPNISLGHRLPLYLAFCLSAHSLEIPRLILYKLREANVLRTAALSSGNVCTVYEQERGLFCPSRFGVYVHFGYISRVFLAADFKISASPLVACHLIVILDSLTSA